MACSCQSLNVSPVGLGGRGEAKAPAGTEFCVFSGAHIVFSCWIADEDGAPADSYTLCFSAGVPCVCSQDCALSASARFPWGTVYKISLILFLPTQPAASEM